MSPLAHPLMLRTLQAALCVCMGAALVANHAHAQSVPTIGATSTIANGAAAGVTGAFAVNETAGLNNAQANQITVSNGGVAGNDNASVQSAAVAAKVTNARASIEANAFSNSSGAVLVNQSAGAGNLQRNSTQLGTAALGVETVADGELSATAAKNGGLGQSAGIHSVREATISDDAFRNISGIVQINQTAGAGNATANSFVLRPPAGTFFN
ncbi:hypothetical protein [Paraburkholderia phytofirmans]|uniref:Conserved hypothetical signal peptide protein n=1 Tax=Paraburkholderia phytofirmans (strain DSM 17436 / LMG 22146 / PsJN) TaxID=398527 RepID=B2T5Y8_PARPJ|nr:hypothetical protein [Paraburkholderia phytofirmans]ACD17352.1 conserved hypothetical signal peptide protein [Paraburkholderia phytofirmans PsJN]